ANCVADTQGGIGYLIQQALNNRLARHGEKKAVTVVTQVEVDKNDPGFAVVRTDAGDYQSVDAVIDKDLSTALLAREIHADILVITTGVEKVCIHFGKPQQQALDRVDIATMTRYMQEGHFPPGSMLPKIIASLTFLEQGGKEVIITTPECLPAALRGETGTHIIKT
ncbi:amino acid kinase family protein, partial [Escherichia coli]|uniref:amino acid kinase family protein n=1 Tax=Escherichia coli TaxID=562 RepID=UPI000FE03A92